VLYLGGVLFGKKRRRQLNGCGPGEKRIAIFYRPGSTPPEQEQLVRGVIGEGKKKNFADRALNKRRAVEDVPRGKRKPYHERGGGAAE